MENNAFSNLEMQCQNNFSPIVPAKLSCIFVSVSIQTEKKTEQTTIHHFSCHRKFWDETNRQAQKPFLPLLSQVSFNSAPNKKEIKNSINTVNSELKADSCDLFQKRAVN